MGVLAPRVGAAALRDQRAEERIGDHVHPRRGRQAIGRCRDDVFAAVGRESTEAVGEDQRARRRGGGDLLAPLLARRHEPWRAHVVQRAARALLGERALGVGDDHPRNRLDQHAILVGDLVAGPHEDPAGAIHELRFGARRDEPDDLVLQQLPVPAVILVPDDEIDGETLEAPVRVRLHELADEIEVGRIGDAQQHDRQVAGDRVAPQPGLSAPIAGDDAGVCAKRRVREDDGIGEPRVEPCVGVGRVDLAQHHLRMRPRELERRDRRAADPGTCGSAGSRRRGLPQRRRPCRSSRPAPARASRGSGSRRSDRAPILRCRTAAPGRVIACGAAGVFAPADEAHPIGFVRRLAGGRAMHRHQVKHPRRLLAGRARPSRAQDRLFAPGDFRLHEEVGERRMAGIGRRQERGRLPRSS